MRPVQREERGVALILFYKRMEVINFHKKADVNNSNRKKEGVL